MGILIKLFGSILVIFSSVGIGFSILKERKEAEMRLRKWANIFEKMEGEIAFRKSTLPEICDRLSMAEKGDDFFMNIKAQMKSGTGKNFREIWEEEIGKTEGYDCMDEEVKGRLKGIGMDLVEEEEEMQRKRLAELEQYLRLTADDIHGKKEKDQKVILCLSLMSGIMVTILLI